MDLTASAAVWGPAVNALVAVARRDHLLLALPAVGAGTVRTARASSPAPTEAGSPRTRLVATSLPLGLGALRPALPRWLRPRSLAFTAIAAVPTPLAGAYARPVSPERDRQVQLVPTR